jgi:hypothetical protein
MPIDPGIYDRLIQPLQKPESPLAIMQGVANLRDTQALAEDRRSLVQDRLQKAQQQADDQRKQAQMQAIVQQNGGDMEKSYPQLAAIDADKADKYLQAHLQNAELQSKLGEIDTQKQSTVAGYVTKNLQGVQNQHDYDVARAQIQSARALVRLPPATEQEMPAVYDPARVSQMIQNGQMTQEVLGKQQKGTPAFYTLPGDPTPHLMKTTPDGQVIWNGQDVREQAQPWDKTAGAEDKVQSAEIEAIKAFTEAHGRKPNEAELDGIHKRFKEAGTVVRVSTGGAAAAGGASDAKTIAQAIISGDQPPDMKGLYRFTGPVRAELARQGYNLTKATEDWNSTSKYLATLNGAQQTRLRQAVEFTRESLPLVQGLVTEWDSAGLPLLSKANLDAAASGAYGAKQQSLAVRLKGQIADLTSELGTVYKGGNSSTDESLKLAAQNLQGNWSKQAALDALKQIDTNLTIRANSIKNTGPVANTGNPYAPQTTAPAQNGPKVGERRNFNGKIGEWDGTGWKAVSNP